MLLWTPFFFYRNPILLATNILRLWKFYQNVFNFHTIHYLFLHYFYSSQKNDFKLSGKKEYLCFIDADVDSTPSIKEHAALLKHFNTAPLFWEQIVKEEYQ